MIVSICFPQFISELTERNAPSSHIFQTRCRKWRKAMTFVVTEACIGVNDQSCIAVCPEDCIVSRLADRISVIDPARCTNCNVCFEACVVGAIFPEELVPPESKEFIALNALWFEDKEAMRARIQEIIDETA
jgi:ferredoxin